MPADSLSDEQAANFGRFAGKLSRVELERFFYLDDADRELIAVRRADCSQLGFALQLGPTAEESLEAAGIGYLADRYELLLDDGRWLQVRVTEVSSDEIRVKKDGWGAIDAPQLEYAVSFPIPEALRSADRD